LLAGEPPAAACVDEGPIYSSPNLLIYLYTQFRNKYSNYTTILQYYYNQVSHLLLQVFDEGRLTDAQGKTVDFRNTVILMTSNLGADALLDLERQEKKQRKERKEAIAGGSGGGGDDAGAGKKEMRRKQQLALGLVQRHFSSEFVNRLDEVSIRH
jgi:hypothetical protein